MLNRTMRTLLRVCLQIRITFQYFQSASCFYQVVSPVDGTRSDSLAKNKNLIDRKAFSTGLPID